MPETQHDELAEVQAYFPAVIKACEGEVIANRAQILDWLYSTQAIVDGKGSDREKAAAILNLLKHFKGDKKALKSFLRAFYKHLWKNRTWSQRCALVGGSVAVLSVGTLSAGIATAGVGVAVSVATLAAAGGSLVGSLIDLVESTAKEVIAQKANSEADKSSSV